MSADTDMPKKHGEIKNLIFQLINISQPNQDTMFLFIFTGYSQIILHF